MGQIDNLPEELLHAILQRSFLLTDTHARRSFHVDNSPHHVEVSRFARITRVSRRFYATGSRILWRNLSVGPPMIKLVEAARLRPGLPAATRSLEIFAYDQLSIMQLRLLLQYMDQLETFTYTIFATSTSIQYTHADFVIHALSAFTRNLKKVVLETGKYSPSPDGLLELLSKQRRLETLHVSDISPRFPHRTKNPPYEPTFCADTLHSLSFGGMGDDVGEPCHLNGLGRFLTSTLPRSALPALKRVYCMSFGRSLRPFIANYCEAVRFLVLRSSDAYAYNMRRHREGHILSTTPNLQHLVWMLDDSSPLDWQPFPESHSSLSSVVLIRGWHSYGKSLNPATLRGALWAVTGCDLPALRTIKIESQLTKGDGVDGAGWFIDALAKLRDSRGGLNVEIMSPEHDGDRRIFDDYGHLLSSS